MTILTTIMTLIIALVVIFIAVIANLYHKYRVKYTQEHMRLESMEQEYSKLVECYKIQKKNKEEADEKINALRNGDVSADNILPKRKG